MRDKLRQIDETFLDLVIGIILCGVVSGILGMIITKGDFWYLFGTLLGVLAAVGMITHMMISIKRAVEMDAHQASRYMVKCSIIRYFIMLLILIPGIKLSFTCFFGILIGLISSKILAAFFKKFIHQHITRKILEI